MTNLNRVSLQKLEQVLGIDHDATERAIDDDEHEQPQSAPQQEELKKEAYASEEKTGTS